MSTNDSSRETAEARFAAKLLRNQEARRAMTEYEADARRTDEKTARLKALRLAKEASEAAPKKTDTPSAKRPARRR
jgi:hypothetical protein